MAMGTDSLLHLDEARQLMADAGPMTAPAMLALAGATGCVLAEPGRAASPLPADDVSAMDGYAVHASELKDRPLPIQHEISAGMTAGRLLPGRCARIFTGAPLPEGADTVVPQEQATRHGDQVTLASQPAGTHVRPRGSVYQAGQILVRAGEVLTPLRIALLAAAGIDRPTVYPRPRVSVLLTGSELVAAGETPRPGQIRDSNGPMLRVLVERSGCDLVHLDTVSDQRDAVTAALRHAVDAAELVLTSGGVSVGDYDFVPDAVRDLGGDILFHRVAMKPGKPILAGRIGGSWLIGLPGNPLSVLTGWRLFGLPLAAALAGWRRPFDEQPLMGTLTSAVANHGRRTLLHPCVRHLDRGRMQIQPLPWKGSHDLLGGAQADALARIEVGQALNPGDSIPYYELDRLHTETFTAAR